MTIIINCKHNQSNKKEQAKTIILDKQQVFLYLPIYFQIHKKINKIIIQAYQLKNTSIYCLIYLIYATSLYHGEFSSK